MTETHQQIEEYRNAVADVAEHIVAEINDADPDEDRDELLVRLLDESTEQHEYVINTDLQIHTLQFSNHPCASFIHGTFKSEYGIHDSFPFQVFAADAFEEDVKDKVVELLDD